MEFSKVKKGEVMTIPCTDVGGKDGFTTSHAPEDGVKVSMDAGEAARGFLYIKESNLRELGYTRAIASQSQK